MNSKTADVQQEKIEGRGKNSGIARRNHFCKTIEREND